MQKRTLKVAASILSIIIFVLMLRLEDSVNAQPAGNWPSYNFHPRLTTRCEEIVRRGQSGGLYVERDFRSNLGNPNAFRIGTAYSGPFNKSNSYGRMGSIMVWCRYSTDQPVRKLIVSSTMGYSIVPNRSTADTGGVAIAIYGEGELPSGADFPGDWQALGTPVSVKWWRPSGGGIDSSVEFTFPNPTQSFSVGLFLLDTWTDHDVEIVASGVRVVVAANILPVTCPYDSPYKGLFC
jgi:hypothetical protein